MTVERHGSGGPYEDQVGYSRVVRAGAHVYVAGCTSTDENGVILYPGDVYEQARQALINIGGALARAGATYSDVVRTRMYVTDISRSHELGRAHAEVFGSIRPVTAMIGVAELLDPRMMVEIEADAYVAPDETPVSL